MYFIKDIITGIKITLKNYFLFQSFLGGFFGPICEIDIILNDAETRKTAEIKTEDGKIEKHFLFYDGESVSGKVRLVCVSNNSFYFLQHINAN